MNTGKAIHRPSTKTEDHPSAGKSDHRIGIRRITFEHFHIVMILLILAFLFLPARAFDNAASNVLQRGANMTPDPHPIKMVDDLNRGPMGISTQSFDCDNSLVSWRAPVRAESYIREHLQLPNTAKIIHEQMRLHPLRDTGECRYTLAGSIHTGGGDRPEVVTAYAATVHYVDDGATWSPVEVVVEDPQVFNPSFEKALFMAGLE
jgi:hypothetical protein